MVNGTLDSELCSPEHLRSARNGQWSMVNGQWSMVNGPLGPMGRLRSITEQEWSMVNGQWSILNAHPHHFLSVLAVLYLLGQAYDVLL